MLILIPPSPVLSKEMMDVGVDSAASLCHYSISAFGIPCLRAVYRPYPPRTASWWHLLLWICSAQALLNLRIIRFLRSCLPRDPGLEAQHRVLGFLLCVSSTVTVERFQDAVELSADGTRSMPLLHVGLGSKTQFPAALHKAN